MGDLSIDHCYLSVVTVVEYRCKKRDHLVKCHTFDPESLKFLPVILRNIEHRAYVVIHKSDIQTFSSFTFQDIKDRIPHISLIHNEILHEDIFLSTLQISYKIIHDIIADGIIFHICMSIQRCLRDILHIITYPICRLRLDIRGLTYIVTLDILINFLLHDSEHILLEPLWNKNMTIQHIHKTSEYRKQQYWHHPCHLYHRIGILCYEMKHHYDTQKFQYSGNIYIPFLQQYDSKYHHNQLDDNQQTRYHHPAEEFVKYFFHACIPLAFLHILFL